MIIEWCLNTLLLIVLLFTNGVPVYVGYIFDDEHTQIIASIRMRNMCGLDQKVLANIELFDNNGCLKRKAVTVSCRLLTVVCHCNAKFNILVCMPDFIVFDSPLKQIQLITANI